MNNDAKNILIKFVDANRHFGRYNFYRYLQNMADDEIKSRSWCFSKIIKKRYLSIYFIYYITEYDQIFHINK